MTEIFVNMVSFVINTCISLVFSVVGKFQVIWTLNPTHYFLLLLHEETLYNTMYTVWISWSSCAHGVQESRKVGNFGLGAASGTCHRGSCPAFVEGRRCHL